MTTLLFMPVDHRNEDHISLLYTILSERASDQSISHKKMPTYDEHALFVASYPYLEWHIINRVSINGESIIPVGSIYLTVQREIGLSILSNERQNGYGKAALQLFMDMYKDPERSYLANINPANTASIRLFESIGFKHIQNTYRLDHD